MEEEELTIGKGCISFPLSLDEGRVEPLFQLRQKDGDGQADRLSISTVVCHMPLAKG